MRESSFNRVNWGLLRNIRWWAKSSFSFSFVVYRLRPPLALSSISSLLLHNGFRSYARPSGVEGSTNPSTESSTRRVRMIDAMKDIDAFFQPY